jgi:hypothetical protein
VKNVTKKEKLSAPNVTETARKSAFIAMERERRSAQVALVQDGKSVVGVMVREVRSAVIATEREKIQTKILASLVLVLEEKNAFRVQGQVMKNVMIAMEMGKRNAVTVQELAMSSVQNATEKKV